MINASSTLSGTPASFNATMLSAVGFASHSVDRAGWLGPMGTAAAHRRRGIGAALRRAVARDLTVASRPDVLQVPSRAITTVNGISTVSVATNGTVNGPTQLRNVQTGLTQNGQTEITSGLRSGEKVIVLTPQLAGGLRLPGAGGGTNTGGGGFPGGFGGGGNFRFGGGGGQAP